MVSKWVCWISVDDELLVRPIKHNHKRLAHTVEKEKQPDPAMETPPHFRCPISMEIMKDPVIISTGVTYERKNIEKWLFTYKKHTCPATNQIINNFNITPNHTLKGLILSWQDQKTHSPSNSSQESIQSKHDELISLLTTIHSTPFKVNSLKKLRSIIELGDETKADFVQSGGVEVLSHIIVQTLAEPSDFITFRACEEALSILHQLAFSDKVLLQMGSLRMAKDEFYPSPNNECIKAMAMMLQRGSAEARLHTVTIFKKMAKVDYNFNWVIEDQSIDLFKSLLEFLSDEINSTASSYALDVLVHIIGSSKKNRLKAIEAGAVCILIELLPDYNGSKCEKILLLIKLLCECAEGRLALVEHGLGIAAVSKKLLHISDTATKLGVKIFWLICSSHPSMKVLEEMSQLGFMKKLFELVHIDGHSSTKDKAMKILKLHGNTWRQYPCFPCNLNDYLNSSNNNLR
ncbi:E3 ubiquitin-protein ligase PUB23-like [Macadamia integrifolia]|uniref:E3 ubiquitin-protein ligase PUB23-like n=1 Tax=Macadamia integrifolia TaxID=60698 RepID=UPI001C4E9C47|nr:E3 ubiquitin-protein ligase PUB23-like [Macadamia integrifolia]